MEPPTPKLFFAQMDSLNDCLVIENLAQVNQTYGKIITLYHISHHITSHHITSRHVTSHHKVASSPIICGQEPGGSIVISSWLAGSEVDNQDLSSNKMEILSVEYIRERRDLKCFQVLNLNDKIMFHFY